MNNNMLYIHLYGDELPADIWEEYCGIVGVEPSETDKITINFDKKLARINKTNEELRDSSLNHLSKYQGSYKIMCVMDIMLDIEPDYRTCFSCSEDMFDNLAELLKGFGKQDNGSGSWYDSLVEFLKKEHKESK